MPAQFRFLRLLAFLGLLLNCVSGFSQEMQHTYNAPVARVFAAEQKAAGPYLKRSVELSCLVQFQTTETSETFSRVISFKATCRDAGNGNTTVTLASQIQSTMSFGDTEAQQKEVARFWSAMDEALRAGAPPASPPAIASTPGGNSSPGATDGVAHISSTPPGAEIEVDGEFVGNTPSDLKLKPGSHSLKVSRKGYAAWQRTIKMEAGESLTFAAELEKLR